MNTDSDWLQITADVDPERLDAWETALLEVGALSITYRDAHDNPVFEPGPGEIALWESLRITALFPQGSERAEVLGRLTARLDGIDPDAVESEQLPDRHWERRTGYHTEHLGRMLSEMQSVHRAYPGCQW